MILKATVSILILLISIQVEAMELSVDDCVRLGLEQNDNLKSIDAEVEIDTQIENIAYADLFPAITLESSYMVRDQPPRFTLEAGLFGQTFPLNDTDVEGEKEHYATALKLNQPLFTGGKLISTHEKQTFMKEARQYQLDDSASRLTYQIKEHFYNALTRQQELASADGTLQLHSEELRILKELALAGKTTKTEVLKSESDLLLAKAVKAQTEQEYMNALADLSALIGVDTAITIKEPTIYSKLSPGFEIDPIVTLDGRNDLRSLDAQINAANKDIAIAKSGYYPHLNLEASYLKQRDTDITEDDIWEAVARVDWSLFEMGKTDFEVAKAKAEHQRLKYIRSDKKRSALNEAQSALRLVRGNELLVEAYKLQLLAVEDEHSNSVELYRAGKKKELDVLNSRAELIKTNTDYRAAINNLRTAQVALENALAVSVADQLEPQEIYQPTGIEQIEWTTEEKELSLKQNNVSTKDIIHYPYSIQLGSFKSEENAHSYMGSLKKGYPEKSFEMLEFDGWLKVRATQFATREEAEKALLAFEGKGIIVHAKPDHSRTD